MIDFDELLQRIPELIGRLIPFDAFAVYLLDEKRGELRIGYAVGYPDTTGFRLRLSKGIVGRVVDDPAGPWCMGDVTHRARLHRSGARHGVAGGRAAHPQDKADRRAEHAEPRARPVFGSRRQHPAAVCLARATALVNARLFEQQRLDAETFELLAEIGREVAAVLDLDQLLVANRAGGRRVVDYRTFGILLLNETTRSSR